MAERRYRVAQWATGDAGMRSLRGIIEHPQFDLVGVRVYSDAKAGKDAGDLCGTAPTGIVATQDIEAIIAARPDCVVYMPAQLEFEVVCRLLEAGANVVTPLTNFNHRDSIDPAMRERLEAACERGQASLYCTGATPGWFTETLPLALALMERRIDCITLFDFGDMTACPSADMLFQMGFGRDPAAMEERAGGTPKIAPGSMAMTAKALGLAIDEFVATTDFALAQSRAELGVATIEPGTIGGVRRSYMGLRHGKPVFCRISVLYVTRDLDQPWELRETGQMMRVEGDVPLDVSFTMLGKPEDYPDITPGMTANPTLNCVPYICAAPPGICQTDELPMMIGRFA